ncbi:helix-turn-helix domain-containing protein [Clostridium sp. FP2]|uniref:helix-turn-helix transcriptional regulator n=1 Tax=Clostridium sp. FP2 TaxID=2724481 RepID=UPI0013E93813|nr:helix-turn-helix transcriptional regulator [Clostridium sp. FP2]MBZ9622934.1 helix-turn-helix domain-containing protein [Clostridium sp. FP2]
MKYLECRLIANLTQQELADKIGVSKTHICDIENGKRNPSVRILLHLAVILSTCPCTLLGCRCDHLQQ